MDRSTIPSSLPFSIERTLEIIERTPAVLRALLTGLSDDWTMHNEGPDTWTPYDIVGHLVHGEKTDWMARIRKCLSTDDKAFVKFDRFAQYEESKGKTLTQLLDEFEELRRANIVAFKALRLSPEQLKSTGIHPTFGEVRLHELIATWAAHDLAHINQISRVMCRQYREAVGPWREFMSILK
jgi:hypothetical protein